MAPVSAPSRETAGNLEHIQAFQHAYSYWYDLYQRYYQEGMKAYCEGTRTGFSAAELGRLAAFLRPLRRVRDRVLSRLPGGVAAAALDSLGLRLEGPLRTPSHTYHPLVGQYIATTADGHTCRFCIDSADYPRLPNAELVSWCDVYFKSNFWPSHPYPRHVQPIVNADPYLVRNGNLLRAYRDRPKEWDICFVARIWGGRNGLEGIEHNLRLLEELARSRARKILIGIVVKGDKKAIAHRLKEAGIESRRHLLRPRRLLEVMSRSSLVVARLGTHGCLPWGLSRTLGIGACIVLDQPPRSQWPEPLKEDENFLSLGTLTGDPWLATDDQYRQIPERVDEWLRRPKELAEIRMANAAYFEQHLDPVRVGEFILQRSLREARQA